MVITLKVPNTSLSLVLGVRNVKTTDWKSWPANLMQVTNFTFDPCFKVKFGHHAKKASYLPHIGPRASKCENHFKSWPANLLKVLNLTFDSFFQIDLDYSAKRALYLPCYWFLSLQPCLKVTLSFLLYTQQEITNTAVVLFRIVFLAVI